MKKINGNLLRDMVISGANNIEKFKTSVNDLNVFPVPDGDTGTNMSLTMSVAAAELRKIADRKAGEVASLTASTLLKGARGNSGVILSLLFRGFAKGIDGNAEVDGALLASSLKLGVEAAYKAVMKPTEGTILTVARIAAERGIEFAKTEKDSVAVLDEVIAAAKETLAKTPEMLPVLKQAGVVDSGGQGFVVIMEGMQSVLKDGKIVDGVAAQETSGRADFAGLTAEDITFAYCTEYIVNRSGKAKPERLRAFLESIGDSVVVADDDEIIKVHVHTNHPGRAIEEGLTFGSLTSMKIDNMKDQFERERHTNKETKENDTRVLTHPPAQTPAATQPAKAEEEMLIAPPEKPFGFVAVSAGEGITKLFCDLGADNVVFGGQTMNPCTEDILKAINKTPAETVFVFPNNKNILFAAQLAIPLTEKEVIVIPTGSIPEGVSALLCFDPDADAKTNAAAMNQIISTVKTGQITYAVRDSEMDGTVIKAGQFMGLYRGKLAALENTPDGALTKLIDKMVEDDSIILTLYYGSDVDEKNAQRLNETLGAKYGGKLDISLVNGGQPVYNYIVSVE